MDRDKKATFQEGSLKLVDRVSTGELKVSSLVETFLSAIDSQEKDIGAWVWHEPEFVRQQATSLDNFRATGKSIGRLHGIPIGIKDIIDTAGIPTENGTIKDKGRVPIKGCLGYSKIEKRRCAVNG